MYLDQIKSSFHQNTIKMGVACSLNPNVSFCPELARILNINTIVELFLADIAKSYECDSQPQGHSSTDVWHCHSKDSKAPSLTITSVDSEWEKSLRIKSQNPLTPDSVYCKISNNIVEKGFACGIQRGLFTYLLKGDQTSCNVSLVGPNLNIDDKCGETHKLPLLDKFIDLTLNPAPSSPIPPQPSSSVSHLKMGAGVAAGTFFGYKAYEKACKAFKSVKPNLSPLEQAKETGNRDSAKKQAIAYSVASAASFAFAMIA